MLLDFHLWTGGGWITTISSKKPAGTITVPRGPIAALSLEAYQ
jgi:hypothetical protein